MLAPGNWAGHVANSKIEQLKRQKVCRKSVENQNIFNMAAVKHCESICLSRGCPVGLSKGCLIGLSKGCIDSAPTM